MKYIVMRALDDFHVHFREIGGLLEHVVPVTAAYCARALAMPNTVRPITSVLRAASYREAIIRASKGLLQPIMSAKLVEGMTPRQIKTLCRAGLICFKLYPSGEGGTTGAQHQGVDITRIRQWAPHFAVMERYDAMLLVHAEVPWARPEQGEQAFLPYLEWIVETFPRLRVVFEHVSSAEGVAWVKAAPATVAATVTPHHFGYVAADTLSPHLCCKPPLKDARHRAAIREAVLSGHPKFIFGSDTAPHEEAAKAKRPPANGVFNALAAPSFMLREFRREFGSVEAAREPLQRFTSEFGAAFYRLPMNTREIVFVNERHRIPDKFAGVVPMCAGEEFDWKVRS